MESAGLSEAAVIEAALQRASALVNEDLQSILATVCSIPAYSASNSDDAIPLTRCGVDGILDGMRAHASSLGVQSMGCEALVLLTTQRARNEASISIDGVKTVCNSLRTHPSSAAVCKFASWLIASQTLRLTDPASLANACSSWGNVVEVLIGSLATQEASADTVEEGLRAVCALCITSAEWSSAFVQGEGVSLLARLNKLHAERRSLTLSILQTLLALSTHLCNTNKAPLAFTAALQLCHQIIQGNSRESEVVRLGLQALHGLARTPAAAQAVVAALHSADGDKAWPTLLAIGKRLDAASDHSRLLCLLHMLMLFDESFRAWCLYSSMISAAQSELASALWEVRVASAATQAAAEHKMDGDVQTAVLLVLLCLALRPSGPQAVMQLRGVDVAVDAMHSHIARPFLQQCGCALLRLLATDESSRVVILDKGGADLLRVVQTRYSRAIGAASEAVSRQAMQALRVFEPSVQASDADPCAGLMGQCVVS